MKAALTILTLLLCVSCSRQKEQNLSVSELAVLSGVSTAIILPTDAEQASANKISIVRIEGEKIKILGGMYMRKEMPPKRILVSLQHLPDKNMLRLSVNGATALQELPADYKPHFWFAGQEKYNGIYMLSAEGDSSNSYRDNKSIAYGIKLESSPINH